MPGATATFDAKDGALQAAFRRIDRNLLGLQKKFASVGAFTAKALALPTAGAIGLGIGVKGALDRGGELSDLASRTGIAAGELAKLQQEFTNNGIAADSLGVNINRMQRALATGTADDMLASMGLSLEELAQMTPDAQFRAIGSAINSIPDPAQRAAAAMQIFGRSGGELLTLFAAGGMADAAQQVGSQAEILNRNASLFDDISDKLGLAGLKTQGFFVGVADKVAPVLKPLLDGFAQMDLAAMGQELGTVIAMVAQAIADGRIGEILLTSLQVSMMNAGNFLVGIFVGAANVIGTLMSEAFRNSIFMFEVLSNPAFWSGMGSALMGIGRGFVALLLDGVAMLLDKLRVIPGLGDKAGGAADALRARADSMRAAGAENSAAAADLLAPIVEQGRARLADALANVGQSFAAGMSTQVFDPTAAQSQLDQIWQEVGNNLAIASEQSLAAAQPKPANPFGGDLEAAGKNALPVSALQRIGGGGGGSGSDPLVSEAKQTNSLLRDIRSALQRTAPTGTGTRAATFSSP